MNNKKSFDDRMKEAGNAPFDADEVFGKEMKAYTNELKLSKMTRKLSIILHDMAETRLTNV